MAGALHALHRQGEALICYEAALAIRPESAETHNNVGNALHDLHRYDEASIHYLAALAIDPKSVAAHCNLGNVLQELNRFDEAFAQYQQALRSEPANLRANQGLAILLLTRGAVEAAQPYGKIGFQAGIEVRPYRGDGPPLPVVVLDSAIGGNVRTEDWLDDRTFASTILTEEFVEQQMSLPAHQLLVNGIGDADRCASALALAATLLRKSTARVINQPAAVLATGRVANAKRLGQLPGVVAPNIELYPRAVLAGPEAQGALAQAGFDWPLLVRSPGYHTGEHFLKVDAPEGLAPAVAKLPGDELLVLEYVNVYGPDGNVRKYRAMIVDGRLYPLHLAISGRWMVHYQSADMAQHPEHRAEDAAFLHDMAGALGAEVAATLGRIKDTLGLDYGGIDFSLDAQGRVVLFEANATMVVPAPDRDERWAYRREAVETIRAAIRGMLLDRTNC